MSAAAQTTTEGAVAALLAVVGEPADPSEGDAAVGRVAEALRRALLADLVAVRVQDPHADRWRIAAASGLAAEAQAELVAPSGPARPDAQVELGPGADGPLAAVIAGAGAPHGVAVPVAEASAGLLLLAAAEPLPGDPLRRAALAAGAGRIGALIDAIRMRDNLERAMAQILATDERMLGRMGLDIHDGPTQQLSVALLEVQLLEADLADAADAGMPAPESLRPALARIYETVGGALHEMRELIGHLRPAQFEDRTLRDILEDAVVAFRVRTDTEVTTEWIGEFPVNGVSITQRITLYRILQEMLSNAQRHGQAASVHVRVEAADPGTTLEVRDDGRGFDPDAVQRRTPGQPLARFGLHGMRDRAQILGGTFAVESAPGRGATVRVHLPRWSGPPPEVAVDVA